MKLAIFYFVLYVALIQLCQAVPLRLQKRAAFYIANETACVVDNLVYSNGDPIPTDDPCEACKCRPPGFACVLKDCPKKPGCRAVRRSGECCPEYVCGCEHNGRMYRDGDEIRDSKNPCYTCHCQGSSIACAFVDCFFRVDCTPEYVQDKCCPEYDHCNESTTSSVGEKHAPTTIVTVNSDVPTYDTTTTHSPTESKVEYVEPEDNTSNESSEEKSVEIETRTHVAPLHTLTDDISEVIHRIAITVQDVEPTKSETTTSEITTKSEESTSESVEEFASEETSSPIVEVEEERSNDDTQVENETKLLKTELDLIDSESNKAEDFSSEDLTSSIFTSTYITVPEANSELFVTTESHPKDGLIPTNGITEENIQTNFPDITESPPLAIEEVEKETNEIKRFRSLNNNSTEDSSEIEDTDVKNNTDSKVSDNESVIIAEIKDLLESMESKIKILSEIEDQKITEKAVETTETTTLSQIPEDKIAEFLISLKKTSSNVPSTDEPVYDSFTTTLSSDSLEKASETKRESEPHDSVTPALIEQTIVENEQQTTNTIIPKDTEHNLGRAISDFLDNQESTAIKTETSTSQVDDTVEISTYKTTVSKSFQTLTTEQQQNAVTESYTTASNTETYSITENDKNTSPIDDIIVINA